MKIVVLDGHTLNPGDLSWDALKALGDVTVHDRTPAGQIIQRAQLAGAVLTNKTPLDAETIEALPKLKYVGVLATGYNVVNIEAAKKRGLIVTNVPAYGTRSVAQTVFALLLELTHHVARHNQSVRAGKWSACEDFSYWETPLIELDGLTMGIVGFGAIGRAVAHLARAFGMNVIVHSRTVRPADGVKFVELDELFRESDVVSLHCPLTPATKGMVNLRRLEAMKKSAFLINTARGALVHEPALATILAAHRIAGAALDTLTTEPPPGNNPLFSVENCIITPHFGWATKAARTRLMKTAVENLRAFIQGHPHNVVS